RKLWPIDLSLKIYNLLCDKVDNQIFKKEILGYCFSFMEYHLRSKKIMQSIATISILGYCVGIGDRHLDNLLLNIQDNEIVLIDFNISFLRGLELPCPELVPFRLTRNMLGLI
ncbi:hypothetical protein K502DRAFT_271647, partial [Neoconidiobolus thromboides FSU 785]